MEATGAILWAVTPYTRAPQQRVHDSGDYFSLSVVRFCETELISNVQILICGIEISMK